MQQTCAEVTQSATTIALAIIGAVGTGISAFIAYKLKVMEYQQRIIQIQTDRRHETRDDKTTAKLT